MGEECANAQIACSINDGKLLMQWYKSFSISILKEKCIFIQRARMKK